MYKTPVKVEKKNPVKVAAGSDLRDVRSVLQNGGVLG